MGPYVIHDLSTSGAVHLATLDGEPMANWISGCRLKKYHETLTTDILEQLHAAKVRKQTKENQKITAIAEAKERAAKLRRRRNQQAETMANTICKKPRLCTMQETDGYIQVIRPYILVHLGSQKIQQYALMDTGADVNSLSYESWESMGNPKLEPSTITLASYTGDASTVEGYLDIQMYIHDTDVSHRFYVLRQGHGNTPVLLGLPWQRHYNGLPSWKKEGITYEVNDKEFFQPFMGAEFYTEEEAKESKSEVHLSDKPKPELQIHERNNFQGDATSIATEVLIPTNTIKPKEISTTTSTKPKQKRGAIPRQVYKWIPRNSLPITEHDQTKPSPRIQHQQKKKTITNTRSTISRRKTIKRWIPKVTLQEQGYYKGQTKIWLPKQMRRTSANLQKPMVQSKTHQHTLTKGPTYEWRPKKVATKISTATAMLQATSQLSAFNPQPPRKATRQEKGKWVPKTDTSARIASSQPKQLTASTTLPTMDRSDEIHAKTAHQLAQQLFCFNRFAILQNLETLLASYATTAK